MKVKMLVSMAGPSGVREPGQIIEASEEEGKRLITAGFAELVAEKVIEATVIEPSERAILPRAKPRQALRKKVK